MGGSGEYGGEKEGIGGDWMALEGAGVGGKGGRGTDKPSGT